MQQNLWNLWIPIGIGTVIAVILFFMITPNPSLFDVIVNLTSICLVNVTIICIRRPSGIMRKITLLKKIRFKFDRTI